MINARRIKGNWKRSNIIFVWDFVLKTIKVSILRYLWRRFYLMIKPGHQRTRLLQIFLILVSTWLDWINLCRERHTILMIVRKLLTLTGIVWLLISLILRNYDWISNLIGLLPKLVYFVYILMRMICQFVFIVAYIWFFVMGHQWIVYTVKLMPLR